MKKIDKFSTEKKYSFGKNIPSIWNKEEEPNQIKALVKFIEEKNPWEIIESFKSTNSNFFYDLQFEDIINSPEKESKKLMEFCELLLYLQKFSCLIILLAFLCFQ